MADTELSTLESLMFSTGLRTPVSRFAGIAVLTDALIYLAKPKYFFDEGSKPIVPWWASGLATGAVAALFL